jgi:transcriptional regulator with XRE-family HTH domain
VLGTVLREVREQAGVTQQALAAKAGMDRAYISEIERGKASPSVDRLFRICQALGVRASTVVARVERRQKRPAPGGT